MNRYDDNQDNVDGNDPNHGNPADSTKPKNISSSPTPLATFVSTSEDSDTDDTSNDNNDEMENTELSGTTNLNDSDGNEEKKADEHDIIHDLSDLVRRKKNGENITPSNSPRRVPSGSSHGVSQHISNRRSVVSHHQQRLVCTLSAHTGSSVLCVRFAPSGRLLASAGDDTCVCIFAPLASPSSVQNKQPEPIWIRIHLCRGHGLDVVGLAWAPDDSFLVSCSLDSATPIIVWKMTPDDASHDQSLLSSVAPVKRKTMILNPYRILGTQGGHTSTVKGVAFDPAGSYLATSGDDPAVCLWRTYDDWGLERRIDASDGIFRAPYRQKDKGTETKSNETAGADSNDNTLGGSSSLFRRLTWSTDGAFVCSTNSVVKNRHVASTISREGWTVNDANGPRRTTTLVGHKFEIVASRASTKLVYGQREKIGHVVHERAPDCEPEYGTLLALGDKSGLLTVWSTRSARPLLKLQCSESRCMVTDLAWGVANNSDLLIFVSLLDGHVVAIRFGVPTELGEILSEQEQARVFRLRYGIDHENGGFARQRRLLVGDDASLTFIENPLQMTLERQSAKQVRAEVGPNSLKLAPEHSLNLPPGSTEPMQVSKTANGKKRVRPLLMNTETVSSKRPQSSAQVNEASEAPSTVVDPMERAMDAARRASSLMETNIRDVAVENVAREKIIDSSTRPADLPFAAPPSVTYRADAVGSSSYSLPHTIARFGSAELPTGRIASFRDLQPVENCTLQYSNTSTAPRGASGNNFPCINVSIKVGGTVTWKDYLPGTFCSAVAVNQYCMAIGTADGQIQLFGASPTIGWTSGSAFRSHPPMVIGHPIVALQLQHIHHTVSKVLMLVVSGDGSFGVYSVIPALSLEYKGSILPALSHMSLSAAAMNSSNLRRQPKLSRALITDSERLLILLSFGREGPKNSQGSDISNIQHVDVSTRQSVGVGGALQAYLYQTTTQLWLRISDSRFVLSHFHTPFPMSGNGSGPEGKGDESSEMTRLEEMVRLGAFESGLHFARSGTADLDALAGTLLDVSGSNESDRILVYTSSHCEDRLAVAVALSSPTDYKAWLSRYVRTLARAGKAGVIRQLVDAILPKISRDSAYNEGNSFWWLSGAPEGLRLDRVDIVKSIILPEMSNNRALQRLTNEIMMEVDIFSATGL
jgi:protein HIRA/HIR1